MTNWCGKEWHISQVISLRCYIQTQPLFLTAWRLGRGCISCVWAASLSDGLPNRFEISEPIHQQHTDEIEALMSLQVQDSVMHDVTNTMWPNVRRAGWNKLQREKCPPWRRGKERFTCDRDFLRELIWDDWSDCSWSDRICLIFSFSMATVLKADFSREWTATQMRL